MSVTALPRTDDAARIRQKFLDIANPESVKRTYAEVASRLVESGICFEGKTLPVSIEPLVVPASEARAIAAAGATVRRVLNRMLDLFVQEHHSKQFDGPIHRFFTPYYKWWDIIAAEQRDDDHIQLMRYDMVRDSTGRWSFMETNCGRPGGTVHCAMIRDFWRDTQLGRHICDAEAVTEAAIDDPAGFVRFLADKATRIDQKNPNIALLTYQGKYPNELNTLQACHSRLVAEGKIEAGELLLGDVREIRCIEGRAYLRGTPLALIHNKFESLDLDPRDPEVRGWVDAAASSGTQFLNSLGAMYLGESKRSLAILSDPAWSIFLSLSPEERTAVQSFVPYTWLIEDLVRDVNIDASLPARGRRTFVLKADSLTRGGGVFLGDNMADEEWLNAICSTRDHHRIAQLKCELPQRVGRQLDPSGQVVEVTEYYGADAFFLGDRFAGLVSRAHVNEIFNVGSGGREVPVLVIGTDND